MGPIAIILGVRFTPKRPVSSSVTSGMSGDAANHLKAVFKLLDVDSSGYIEEVEGMRVGKALG